MLIKTLAIAGASSAVLAGGIGTALVVSGGAAIDDKTIFCSEFVPNEKASWQPGKVLAKWANANPTERDSWAAFADSICTDHAPVPPLLTTLHGKTLVAAGKMALPESAPPPTTTTTTATTTTTTTTTTGAKANIWVAKP